MTTYKLLKLSGSILSLTLVLSFCGCTEKSPTGINNNLQLAAESGNVKEVSRLLSIGADVNSKGKNSFTPLHFAAFQGHKDVAELLIAKGADINAKGRDDTSPLHVAAFRGHRDVAKLLIAKGAGINAKAKDDATPLHLAALNGHKDVAELLIAKDVDINASDIDGHTPLNYATEKKGNAVAELLWQHGGITAMGFVSTSFAPDMRFNPDMQQESAVFAFSPIVDISQILGCWQRINFTDPVMKKLNKFEIFSADKNQYFCFLEGGGFLSMHTNSDVYQSASQVMALGKLFPVVEEYSIPNAGIIFTYHKDARQKTYWISRLITRDTIFAGVELKEGDVLMTIRIMKTGKDVYSRFLRKIR